MGMIKATTDKTVIVYAMKAYSGSRFRTVIILNPGNRRIHGWQTSHSRSLKRVPNTP